MARTTPHVNAQVRTLLQDPNHAPDIPGTKLKTRLWGASGMATRIDSAGRRIDVAQGGVIYRAPTIRTDAGIAALETFKAGDRVTLLFTEHTAVEIKQVQVLPPGRARHRWGSARDQQHPVVGKQKRAIRKWPRNFVSRLPRGGRNC